LFERKPIIKQQQIAYYETYFIVLPIYTVATVTN